jgi:hypothetical protein
MAFHHVAIATVTSKRATGSTPRQWASSWCRSTSSPSSNPVGRHLFYDTGNGELIALWDLHDEDGALGDFDPAISTGLGLPNFVNHIAFGATDLDELDARKDRLVANGHDVARIDHGWCTSIYANDPSGIMVEFCTTTKVLGEEEPERSARAARAGAPPVSKALPNVEFFEGLPRPTTPASRSASISAAEAAGDVAQDRFGIGAELRPPWRIAPGVRDELRDHIGHRHRLREPGRQAHDHVARAMCGSCSRSGAR